MPANQQMIPTERRTSRLAALPATVSAGAIKSIATAAATSRPVKDFTGDHRPLSWRQGYAIKPFLSTAP